MGIDAVGHYFWHHAALEAMSPPGYKCLRWKHPKCFWFWLTKMKCWGSHEIPFGQVSSQSEPSSGDKHLFATTCHFNGFGRHRQTETLVTAWKVIWQRLVPIRVIFKWQTAVRSLLSRAPDRISYLTSIPICRVCERIFNTLKLTSLRHPRPLALPDPKLSAFLPLSKSIPSPIDGIRDLLRLHPEMTLACSLEQPHSFTSRSHSKRSRGELPRISFYTVKYRWPGPLLHFYMFFWSFCIFSLENVVIHNKRRSGSSHLYFIV